MALIFTFEANQYSKNKFRLKDTTGSFDVVGNAGGWSPTTPDTNPRTADVQDYLTTKGVLIQATSPSGVILEYFNTAEILSRLFPSINGEYIYLTPQNFGKAADYVFEDGLWTIVVQVSGRWTNDAAVEGGFLSLYTVKVYCIKAVQCCQAQLLRDNPVDCDNVDVASKGIAATAKLAELENNITDSHWEEADCVLEVLQELCTGVTCC